MEIVPNVHRVPGVRGVNVYLLLGGAPVLVDTGMPGSDKAIIDYVEKIGLASHDLTRIVLTHYHVDHVGSLAALKRRTPALIAAHPADAPYIAGDRPQPAPHGVLVRLAVRLVPMMSRFDPVPVDLPVHDGDRLDILGGAVVVHLPGHTPGSIALHLPAEGVLLCGDTVACRGPVRGSRTDRRPTLPANPFTIDRAQAVASLRRMAELDFDVLCPGHGEPLVGGASRRVRDLARRGI